jgi:hypothetical protein
MAVIGLSVLAAANAPGAGSPAGGRRIEFSQPTNSEEVVSTNLLRSKLTTGAPSEFAPPANATLDFLNGPSSGEAPSMAPPQSFILSMKQLQEGRERLERRKNWASASPEDLLLERTSGSMDSDLQGGTKTAEQQERSQRLRLERWSARRQAEAAEESRDSSGSRQRQGEARGRDQQTEAPDQFKADEKQLKEIRKALQEAADPSPFFNVPSPTISFGEFFGVGEPKPKSLEEAAHHKALMEEFKQVLELPLSTTFSGRLGVSPGGSVGDFTGGVGVGGPAVAPLFSSPFGPPAGAGSQAGGAALATGAAEGALNQQLLGGSATPAQPAPAPAMAPPAPNFIFPRRAFQ